LGWRSRNNDCIFHTGRYSWAPSTCCCPTCPV
jgi:hypothetical protein